MLSTSKHTYFLRFISRRAIDSESSPTKHEESRMLCRILNLRLRYSIERTAIVGILLAFSLFASAQTHMIADSAAIHFPLSHYDISLSMNSNKAEIERITDFIHRYSDPSSGYALRSIKVVGGASPEGSVEINERLSRRRAAAIFDYVSQRETLPDTAVTFIFLGRDWKGLRDLVENDTQVPFQAEVLALINETIADSLDNTVAADRNITKLRRLHNGVPYRYITAKLFPALRASRLFVEYESPALRDIVAVPDAPADTFIIYEATEDFIEVVTETAPDGKSDCKPLYLNFKTNMLYDALALPSVGAEFYVGKKWSLGINWTYGWWSKDKRHRYWRAYGGDVNMRRWFGHKADEKPLTGHHLGLYAGIVTYDFEFGGKGYMGGLPLRTLWDRCNYTGGIEYGYSAPISRRLNIDFTLGIGYLGGKYLEYVPQGNRYVWQRTMRLQWFGPTKAEISLVWLIGCDNYNRRREGGNL